MLSKHIAGQVSDAEKALNCLTADSSPYNVSLLLLQFMASTALASLLIGLITCRRGLKGTFKRNVKWICLLVTFFL